ncbi:MAG: hypothetical protein E7214_13215 [Clostridium sp.]|nr:hypothetical protein [Clostridium sp.]
MGKINDRRSLLLIDKECVFRTKTEKTEDFKTSIFRDQYLKAYICLEEIVKTVKEYNELIKIDSKYSKEYDFNNIIAFVGDKGTGKTSSMKSFKKSLQDINLRKIDIEEYEEIHKYNYECLNTIDSTKMLSNENTIIELIVAQMLKNFNEKDAIYSRVEKEKLENLFELVYKDINVVKSYESSFSNNKIEKLENLVDLYSAISLKDHLSKLIYKYLCFMREKDSTEEEFLVVTIDNIKVKSNQCIKILKDINNYLLIPSVIILVGVQEEAKYRYEEKYNEEMLKHVEYLDEFVPFNRRVYMPSLDYKMIKLNIDTEYFNNISYVEEDNMSKIIINLMNKKLNYIIVTENHYKSIISNNLRGIIDFIVLLNSIKDNYDYNRKFEIMISYYEKVILEEFSDGIFKDILKDILKTPSKNINKRILMALNELVYNKREDFDVDENLWKDVMYIKSKKLLIQEDKITLGDLVSWIKRYEQVIDSDKERRFLEIIKSIYTLNLLKEFFNNSPELMNRTGFDFIGEYFRVTNNRNKSMFSKGIDINQKRGLLILKESFLIINNFGLSIVLHPCYDIDNIYSKLIRTEKIEFLNIQNIGDFSNLEFNYLNILAYSLYKDQINEKFSKDNEEEDEFEDLFEEEEEYNRYLIPILNMDLWLKILGLLNSKYDRYNSADEDFINSSINLLNDVFDKYNEKFDFNANLYNKVINEEDADLLSKLDDIFTRGCYLYKYNNAR